MANIKELIHPEYAANLPNWRKYRLVYEGGQEFIRKYLRKYSRFEQAQDFRDRADVTYNPGTAAATITTIKNSIYQRLVDVTRKGGDPTYQRAMEGGVDDDRHSMNSFTGTELLPELLSIGKVFVHVDAPKLPANPSVLDTQGKRPYLYIYEAEDVPSWTEGADGRLSAILVKAHEEVVDSETGLTSGLTCVYRLFRKIDSVVSVTTYDEDGEQIGGVDILELTDIPIICIELEDSLLKDVADYQIAALQLASSDVNFLFRGNFPLYTEQVDSRLQNWNRGPAHPGSIGTARDATDSIESRVTRQLDVDPPQDENSPQVFAGVGKGRAYPTNTERPGYVAPSTDGVKASMEKQKEMKMEVRELVNLALSSMAASYASGSSKKMDQVGLEAGLSYIGLILEHVENEIARIWQLYMHGEVAVVKYPTNYTLKTEDDRLEQGKKYKELLGAVPSQTYSKQMAKKLAHTLIGPDGDIEKINSEIDSAKGISGDSEQIAKDVEMGLVSNATASELRGYDPKEAKLAEEDHARRAARIAAAQSIASGPKDKTMPGQGSMTKEASKDPTMSDEMGMKQRGPANN